MRNKSIIALVIALGLLLVGSVWWLNQNGSHKQKLEELELRGISAVLQYDVTDPRKVHFLWQGITGDTAAIRVYRSKDNGSTWELWQEVKAPDAAGERAFITEGANARDYTYRVEIVTVNGEKVLVVPSTTLAPPTTPASSTNTSEPTETTTLGASSTNPGIGSVVNTTPGVESPTTTQPTATSSTPAPAASNATKIFMTYYTPSGAVSGTSSIPLIADTVWVRHYGDNIEVGWQNLPADARTVLVSRSSSASGPWKKLLQHDSVTGIPVGSVQFSNAIPHEDQYYQFEVTRISGEVSMLGIVFLPRIP